MEDASNKIIVKRYTLLYSGNIVDKAIQLTLYINSFNLNSHFLVIISPVSRKLGQARAEVTCHLLYVLILRNCQSNKTITDILRYEFYICLHDQERGRVLLRERDRVGVFMEKNIFVYLQT